MCSVYLYVGGKINDSILFYYLTIKKELHRADKSSDKVLTYSSAEQHGGIVEVVHETVHHQSKVPHPQGTMFLNTIKTLSPLYDL